MMGLFDWLGATERKVKKAPTLSDFSGLERITDSGILFSENRRGLMFELEGVDASFFSAAELTRLHQSWRSAFRLLPGEEIQIVFRKRVEFSAWVEAQMQQAFLAKTKYGRRILLDRLNDQVLEMSREEPQLLHQSILLCFWTSELTEEEELLQKRSLLRSQLSALGTRVESLDRKKILQAMNVSAQDLNGSSEQEPEWPSLGIEAGRIKVNGDCFRAAELSKLPEASTELGMIQALTSLPYPLDLCVRLKARDMRPVVTRLERKRNLLHAQRQSKGSPSPQIDSQIEQIDQVLRSLADHSDGLFDLQMTVGLRLSESLNSSLRKALATVLRSGSKMNFCEFEECTLGTFDAYLECIPGLRGQNIRSHTVLASNAIHFLPFFCTSKGDRRAVVSFQTRSGSLYGIDPVDPQLANYNWLVSGTSGAGKSFFVNSLLSQSLSIDPDIFIVDIGGSYNKLTQFLGGKVMSLEPGQGFELSPFFLSKSDDVKEERMRREQILRVFLEMTRVDGHLPSIEVRQRLTDELNELFDQVLLPERPITHLVERLEKDVSPEARQLRILLRPWTQKNGFFGQFLDNNKPFTFEDRVLTFDLKGLTDFEDLSRVVQLIVCASVWARIRRGGSQRFSWIVLDEVAFSLLKTQPEFVDELVATLRKYFAGAVVVVQDLEKITSNLAGSSILQNSQTKAILQQRGDPRNFTEALSLSPTDVWAIESLKREKGRYSEVFLIRDRDKAIIRHVPSELEYWLATTSAEDNGSLKKALVDTNQAFQKRVLDFVSERKGARS